MIQQWILEGAVKDKQSITSDWQFTNQQLIDGVKVKEVLNVAREIGTLTEIFRQDWNLDLGIVAQVFQVKLFPGCLSAWHAHEFTLDRLFVNDGVIKIVLYDTRKNSPTYGYINEFRLGSMRPGLIVIPPGIWHGVQNISNEVSSLLNLVDKAYNYDDPDNWKLPSDSPQIPYAFKTNRTGSHPVGTNGQKVTI
jgi:dTDP-4-dehydrorhamnose 3,5-epimerase